ncbi:uncharacterized protein LOC129774021 [Toxorhynchites rutilus septentrionalis]|uniref:uncharacterized protein LOC129774021 n=1 Tax=Toxorhynchites rutilus septentrionalis TaxID=329112 RepID=UPI002478A4FD|nr:uncharacterized protein LOC129774021 [Toxorhynchites rutilus septentrionalis]
MPNNAGPSSSKRRLLASVATSILRYGGPAWTAALKLQQNRRLLNRTYRMTAMRVASAYKTISAEVVCVIAGLVPIEITLSEDSVCYNLRTTSTQSNREARVTARDDGDESSQCL